MIMNNDNYLNLHSMTKLPGWLRYWVKHAISNKGFNACVIRVSANKNKQS